jgi:hypothetical protein
MSEEAGRKRLKVTIQIRHDGPFVKALAVVDDNEPVFLIAVQAKVYDEDEEVQEDFQALAIKMFRSMAEHHDPSVQFHGYSVRKL